MGLACGGWKCARDEADAWAEEKRAARPTSCILYILAFSLIRGSIRNGPQDHATGLFQAVLQV